MSTGICEYGHQEGISTSYLERTLNSSTVPGPLAALTKPLVSELDVDISQNS